MYINPFVAGILVTIMCEFIVVCIAVIVSASKTHRNTSKSSRSDKNE